MNTNFKLGSFDVKIPAGDCNPEINVSLKDVSIEVTDLSLTEYAGVMKTLISEVGSQIKEFGRMQEESSLKAHERREALAEAEHKRQISLHEMRMKEHESRNSRTLLLRGQEPYTPADAETSEEFALTR